MTPGETPSDAELRETYQLARLSLGLSADPERDRIAAGRVPDSMDMAGYGIEHSVAVYLELFQRSRESRRRIEKARSAGISYSETMARWTADDIAAELACDILESMEHFKRCPKCGIDPDDVRNSETFRRLKKGRWKVERRDCYVCEEVSRAEEDLGKRGGKKGSPPGASITVSPRKPGENFREW